MREEKPWVCYSVSWDFMADLLGQPLGLKGKPVKVNPRLFKSCSLGSFLSCGTETATDNTAASFSSFPLGGKGSPHRSSIFCVPIKKIKLTFEIAGVPALLGEGNSQHPVGREVASWEGARVC